MSMRVSASDGVKVYNICSGKAVPQWLSESKKKSLKKNEEYRRRLELLQDLKFPAACQRIKVTPDQQYIFATGYHPPQAKVYDLANLALKFDRHLDSEVVDFQILSEDYSKAAFLCADRTVCFHARFGSYHKTRVPRFVTKADLVRLGLEHLVGTALLRAYMHGFFIDNRLYHKAKSLTEPFAYEVYRQQRIAKKMEEERASRISLVKKLPKVNTRVAAKLVAQEEEARAAAAGDTAAQAALKKKGLLAPDGSASLANPLADDRFKAMFEDTDFAVDEGAEEYKALHPNAEHRKSKRDETDLLMEHFEELSGSGASSSASEDEDDVLFKTGRQGDSSSDEEDGDRRSRQPAARHGSKAGLGKGAALHAVTGGVQKQRAGQGGKGPAMFAAKDVASLQAFQKKESKADLLSQTFAERVAMQGQGATTARRVGGSREIVFRPLDGYAGNRGQGRGRGREQMGAGRNDGGDDDAVGSERGRGGGRGGRGRSSRGRGGSSGRGRTWGSRGRGRGH